MIEQGSKYNLEIKRHQSPLRENTRRLIQHAFASGAANGLDERRRWLLARYAGDKELTVKGLKIYVGANTEERARQALISAVTRIWEASPDEVQRKFPKEEIAFIRK